MLLRCSVRRIDYLFSARKPKRLWRRNREEVERRLARQNLYAAVCGLMGMFMSIVQNEMVVRNVPVILLPAPLEGCRRLTAIVIVVLTWLQ